ncbi:MAG: MATE family efflux transporter [Prevotella sp.]|nr:MATE family efflux transporter [Prevotella sp.]
MNDAKERTKKVRLNIIGSALLKGVNILVSLLLIPLTIKFVNSTQYGIWLTISSIVAWIGYFDLGLSLGFKNKFAEARALNKISLAKQYVSTTYAVIFLMFFSLALVALVLNSFIDWASFLNIELSYTSELQMVFSILIVYFSSNMILRIVCTMLDACQRNVISDFILTIGQILMLAVIYVMMHVIPKGSLTILSLAYSCTPLIVLIIATLIVFRLPEFRSFAPTFSTIRFKLTGSILSLGVQFFFIMVSMLMIYQIVNVIISRNLGPEVVTQYNVAYKYFSILLMGIIVILNPLWAAFTEAYTKSDKVWMKNVLHNMEKMIPVIVLAMSAMFLCSGLFFKLWVGDDVDIPLITSASIAFYALMQVIANIYMYLINGIGKVRLQTAIYVTFALLAIPVMDYFCKLFGVPGLLFIPTLVYLLQTITGWIQIRMLISDTAKGIWNK